MAFHVYQDNPTPACMRLLDEECLSDSPLIYRDGDEDVSDSGLGSPLSELERFLTSPGNPRLRRNVRPRRRLFTNKRLRCETTDETDSSDEEDSKYRKRRRIHAPLTSPVSCQSGETTEAISRVLPSSISDECCVNSLPTVKGTSDEINSIDHHTLANLLGGEYKAIEEFQIIDCRYPYEYIGGHIEGAINIYTREGVDGFLQSIKSQTTKDIGKRVVILYSESSDRGTKQLRYLRNTDRRLNLDRYPELFYPEIYLLDGGYSAFFQHHKKTCYPRQYVQMHHPCHYRDLSHFRCREQRAIKDLKRERNVKLQDLCQSQEF